MPDSASRHELRVSEIALGDSLVVHDATTEQPFVLDSVAAYTWAAWREGLIPAQIAGEPGPLQRVVFPGVLMILNQAAGTPPPTDGSVGSVVNHVGFIVQNVQESVAKWKAVLDWKVALNQFTLLWEDRIRAATR